MRRVTQYGHAAVSKSNSLGSVANYTSGGGEFNRSFCFRDMTEMLLQTGSRYQSYQAERLSQGQALSKKEWLLYISPASMYQTLRTLPSVPVCPAPDRKVAPKSFTPSMFTYTIFCYGPAGSGNTTNAITLADNLKSRDEPLRRFIGLYMRASSLLEDNAALDEGVIANRIADKARALYDECPRDEGLGDVTFFLIVDDAGNEPELVDKLQRLSLDSALNTRFDGACRRRGFDIGRSMLVLAGAGIPPPPRHSAYSKGYTNNSNFPIQIFKERCIQDSGVAASVVDSISLIPPINTMITNTRCAVFASNKVVALLKAMPADLPPGEVVERVRGEAENIAVEVAQEFMKVGSWGAMAKENVEYLTLLARAMLTLSVTQKHGYHLLTPQVQRDLCCRLGIVLDGVVLDHYYRHDWPVLPDSASALGAFSLEPNKSGSDLHPRPLFGGYRFDISPAMAMVALLHLAGVRGTSAISTAMPSPSQISAIVTRSLISTLCHVHQHRDDAVSHTSIPDQVLTHQPVDVPLWFLFPDVQLPPSPSAHGMPLVQFDNDCMTLQLPAARLTEKYTDGLVDAGELQLQAHRMGYQEIIITIDREPKDSRTSRAGGWEQLIGGCGRFLKTARGPLSVSQSDAQWLIIAPASSPETETDESPCPETHTPHHEVEYLILNGPLAKIPPSISVRFRMVVPTKGKKSKSVDCVVRARNCTIATLAYSCTSLTAPSSSQAPIQTAPLWAKAGAKRLRS